MYEVSDRGDIRRLKPAKGAIVGAVTKGTVDPKGYRRTRLSLSGRSEEVLVHRVVCRAFHGPAPEGKPLVLHGDGDPGNNQTNNLRWGSHRDNLQDSVRHGTNYNPGTRNASKTHCIRGHEFTERNTYRDSLSRRVCRRCHVLYYEKTTAIGLTVSDRRHGTANGYLNFKCRCDPCKVAYSRYCKDRTQRAN